VTTDTDTHEIVGAEPANDKGDAGTGGLRRRIVARAQRLTGGREHRRVIDTAQASAELMEAEPDTVIRLTAVQRDQLRAIEALMKQPAGAGPGRAS
jgi:hypothetical protein